MGNPSSKNHSSVNEDYVTVKTYTGETKNGKRHGRGIYMYPNGDMYDGEWRKSSKYGRGVYTYSDGQRLDGFFYKDKYIGKVPNEKIKKWMAKKLKTDERAENISMTEQTEMSNDAVLDDLKESPFKLKSEGSNFRRAQSERRNKWIRDKYKIQSKNDIECVDSSESGHDKGQKHEEEFLHNSKKMKRSYSLGDKRRKGRDLDEAAERKRSQKLRESIRQKYNLKGRGKQDLLLNSE